MDLARCSLNSVTVRAASFDELVMLAERHGFGGVGLWRDSFADVGVEAAARRVRAAGLRVTSVCRGGMFPQRDEAGRRAAHDDNRRAVDETRELGGDCLVLVCGAATGRDLAAARAQIEDGIAELLPHAGAAGVPLAVEPMHPMMIADRSAITSLAEANDLVERLASPWLGLALDSYHLWWDAALAAELARAAGRMLSVQLSDWVLPIRGLLSSRGMPGEGCIDLEAFVAATRRAGYAGLVEVEVLSERWWGVAPADGARAAAAALSAVPDSAVPDSAALLH
ncbi:sugar phosphate isomerase/epimerase [Pseudonocardia sp. WMMC193]|uniref:sugar phosphate isomerase/epimerase family protein n=1 Tax=Pseudonocardia sp. WMMC193 TaxID=2911965 RepID=UPI001F3A5C47|nr:sugar phosphate isomerase/epimerase family protein [Pseudonocardia sp. WMMC193]MCF7548604.1 sugar phosphate isomerase/epimerase [Pseudonocardia sp. WMMC193]